MARWLRWIAEGNYPYLKFNIAWDFDGFHAACSTAWVWTPRLLNQRPAPWQKEEDYV